MGCKHCRVFEPEAHNFLKLPPNKRAAATIEELISNKAFRKFAESDTKCSHCGQTGGIIATELVRTVTKYFQDKNVAVKKIEYSYGATEVKARLVDAIADVTETGSSLHANKLRVIDTVLTSTTRLIVNHDSWSNADKRRKIEDIALLLRGAMSARQKVGLKMNVPKAQLDAVLALLPSERSPTISALAEDNWVAVEVIVDQATERDLVPGLSRNGATGIITYPLNKVIP